MKIALTHDVDRTKKTYQYFTHLLKSAKKLNYPQISYHIKSFFSKKEPYWNFEKIIKIENKYNIKSTFFFLNESIKFNPFKISNWILSLGRYNIYSSKVESIINYLDRNGWEIGVHGSYNSYKDENLMAREKKDLEQLVGHRIDGIRQHHLNLDNNTWKIQKQVGFKYDSSYGYTRNIGFKNKMYNFILPFNDEFVVFPLIIMDFCFMKKRNKWKEFLRISDIVEEKRSLLVINWHQSVFNEKEFPGYKKYYVKIIEECLKRNATFVTLKEYYNAYSQSEGK